MNIIFDLCLAYNRWRIVGIFINGLVRGLCMVLLLLRMSGFIGCGRPRFWKLRLGLWGLCCASFLGLVWSLLLVLVIALNKHKPELVFIFTFCQPSWPNPRNFSHLQVWVISPIFIYSCSQNQNMRSLQ